VKKKKIKKEREKPKHEKKGSSRENTESGV
jgi:hypothetical protein